VVVATPDAVVDPGTVVVKSVDTSVAQAAVTSAGCPYDLAVRTYVMTLESFEHFFEVKGCQFIKVAWVFNTCAEEEEKT
jgi:hypothetical protein